MSDSGRKLPYFSIADFGAKGDGVTDDTTAFVNAASKASAVGSAVGARCQVFLVPGKNYLITSVAVPSYVEFVGYGAIITRSGSANSGTFDCSNSTDVCFRGLHFAAGTGTETGGLHVHIFGTQAQYVRVLECIASNWGQSAVYLVDSQWLWVLDCVFTNVGMTTGGTNGINFVMSSNGVTLPLKHIWCGRNYVTANNIGISIGVSTTSTRIDPDVDAHVFHNTSINLATGSAWAMGIEQGSGPAAVSGFEFTGNICYTLNSFNGVGSRTYAFVISSSVTSPTNITGVSITGGRMISNASNTNRGMLIEASDVTITGVEIEAGEIDIVWQGAGGGNMTKLSVVGCQSHLGAGTQVQVGANADGTSLSMAGTPPVGVVTVAVPASGTAVAAQPYNRVFYVTAATAGCTMAVQNGPSVVIPAATMGTVEVPAGCTVTPTYTNAPTWVVQGR